MIVTPLEPFHVMTPLGSALCIGVYAASEDPEWLTFIDATGEPWWWTGRHIRRRPNPTNAARGMSGFSQINEPLWRHIERYQAGGFLPAGFNPELPETW